MAHAKLTDDPGTRMLDICKAESMHQEFQDGYRDVTRIAEELNVAEAFGDLQKSLLAYSVKLADQMWCDTNSLGKKIFDDFVAATEKVEGKFAAKDIKADFELRESFTEASLLKDYDGLVHKAVAKNLNVAYARHKSFSKGSKTFLETMLPKAPPKGDDMVSELKATISGPGVEAAISAFAHLTVLSACVRKLRGSETRKELKKACPKAASDLVCPKMALLLSS